MRGQINLNLRANGECLDVVAQNEMLGNKHATMMIHKTRVSEYTMKLFHSALSMHIGLKIQAAEMRSCLNQFSVFPLGGLNKYH